VTTQKTQKQGTIDRALPFLLYQPRTFAARTAFSASQSVVVRDQEAARKTSVWLSIFLLHFANARESRAALELQAELLQAFRRAAGKYFHTAVLEITHVATQMQFCRCVLREIAEPHTLYGAGDEVPLGLLRLAHGT